MCKPAFGRGIRGWTAVTTPLSMRRCSACALRVLTGLCVLLHADVGAGACGVCLCVWCGVVRCWCGVVCVWCEVWCGVVWCVVVCGVVCGVWCRQDENDDMFIHTTACAHRIGGRTPGSETPSVPATWASTSSWTEAEKCCKTEAKTIIAATKPVITGNPCIACTVRTSLCCATGRSSNCAMN